MVSGWLKFFFNSVCFFFFWGGGGVVGGGGGGGGGGGYPPRTGATGTVSDIQRKQIKTIKGMKMNTQRDERETREKWANWFWLSDDGRGGNFLVTVGPTTVPQWMRFAFYMWHYAARLPSLSISPPTPILFFPVNHAFTRLCPPALASVWRQCN
jgi:hypothetical protein